MADEQGTGLTGEDTGFSPGQDEIDTDLRAAANAAALAEQQQDATQPPKRSLLGLAVVITLVVLVILLLLLLLRDCGGGEGAAESGGKTIEEVRGLDPVDGVISVWVKPEAEIEPVLLLVRLSGGQWLDMGDGRYVVQVPVGREAAIATELRELEDVYDAGLVYESPEDAAEETSAP